jgi:glycosyltransferase involved in cell wall biosynthesis
MTAVAVEHERTVRATTLRLPRRVCLVTESAGGGVGRHFLDLASALAGRGIDVTAIYSPGRCDSAFRDHRVSADGVQFIELPMRRAVHLLDALDVAQLIRTIRAAGSFDLIHAHSSKAGALARLAARWLSIPIVYTPHAFVTLDPALGKLKRQFYGRIEHSLARRTSAIIAVSADEAAHARELGIDRAKIHVVHNGIPPLELPPREAVRARLGLSPEDFVIGFVGRLVPQKAPDMLAEAFSSVARQHPESKLVLIGSGPLEASIRQQIKALQQGPRVLLLGDTIAPSLLPAFDVFCLPSRYEGMPYVLLEALAAGLPIVATRVGGATTCVAEGENGFIVEPGNASLLARPLLELARDASLRNRLALGSRHRAARFSATQMVENTLEVYRRVLSSCAHTSG